MKYVGNFKDINEKLYTIEIITNNESSKSQSIEFTDTPILVSMEGGSDLYKPIIYHSATINILQTEYNSDLYNKTAQCNKVLLKDSENKILFVGYLTPNLYNMNYTNILENIELEATDALATLKYIEYKTINENRTIVTFASIVQNILNKCNAYSKFYISTNKNVDLNNLIISEENFFDEDDDAMKCDEVLEEICKFLNVTCIAEGDSVFFIDYDAIKNGINTYYEYFLNNIDTKEINTLQNTYNINKDDIACADTNISLDNVYNKVTVKDSLYSFNSAVPDYFDNKYLYNKTSEDSDFEAFEIREANYVDKFKVYTQYFYSKYIEDYWYDPNTNERILHPSVVSYNVAKEHRCAVLVRQYVYPVKDFSEEPNNLNFEEYIMCNTKNLLSISDTNRKYFTIKSENPDNKKYFLGGNNMFLVLKGSVNFIRGEFLFIPPNGANQEDDKAEADVQIKCMLKLGNLYWDGSNWVNQETTFNLVFDAKGQIFTNNFFNIKNNITYKMGLDGEGFAIKLPENVTTDTPELTVYEPNYTITTAFFKDLKVEIQVAKEDLGLGKEEAETDTEYFNIINEDFVNEYSTIGFKICTWDNKLPNYSCVVENKSNGKYFLDKVHSQHNNTDLRMEEHYIDKITNQYSTPSLIINTALNKKLDINTLITYNTQFPTKKFVITDTTFNYRMSNFEYKIIEKK